MGPRNTGLQPQKGPGGLQRGRAFNQAVGVFSALDNRTKDTTSFDTPTPFPFPKTAGQRQQSETEEGEVPNQSDKQPTNETDMKTFRLNLNQMRNTIIRKKNEGGDKVPLTSTAAPNTTLSSGQNIPNFIPKSAQQSSTPELVSKTPEPTKTLDAVANVTPAPPKDVVKPPAKDVMKIPTKAAPPKDVVKPPAKDVMKAPPKDVVKPPAKDVMKAAPKIPPKAAPTKAAPKVPSKAAPKIPPKAPSDVAVRPVSNPETAAQLPPAKAAESGGKAQQSSASGLHSADFKGPAELGELLPKKAAAKQAAPPPNEPTLTVNLPQKRVQQKQQEQQQQGVKRGVQQSPSLPPPKKTSSPARKQPSPPSSSVVGPTSSEPLTSLPAPTSDGDEPSASIISDHSLPPSSAVKEDTPLDMGTTETRMQVDSLGEAEADILYALPDVQKSELMLSLTEEEERLQREIDAAWSYSWEQLTGEEKVENIHIFSEDLRKISEVLDRRKKELDNLLDEAEEVFELV